MTTVRKEDIRGALEEAYEDLALLEAGVLRTIVLAQSARNRLNSTWDMVGLGDRPEYEPQITLRKGS